MDTQVSVATTSAPSRASAASIVTSTEPPVSAARSSAAAMISGDGRYPSGPAMRTFMPAVTPASR